MSGPLIAWWRASGGAQTARRTRVDTTNWSQWSRPNWPLSSGENADHRAGYCWRMKRVSGGIALIVAVAMLSSCGGTAGKLKNLATGKTGKQIQQFEQQVENAQKAVFTADYQSTDSGGKSETIHVAQKPPKSLFKTNDTAVINDGTNTYTCSPSGSNGET